MNSQPKDTWFCWVICIASFCGQALSVGFFFAFGTIYVSLIKEFGINETQAAWIGSLAYSLCFLFGYITSILCKRVGARITMMGGGVLYCLGFIISSFVTHYTMLFISYSLIVGLGASAAFFCSLLVLPLYFEKKLAFANGIVSAGSGFGGLIISPTIEYLLRMYGFRGTMRIYSISALLLILGGLSYTRRYPKQEEEQRSKLIDKTLLKNKAYLVWSACLCIILFGYYVPYVHLVHLAEEMGVSTKNASYLLSVASMSQIAGKIFFGKLADNYRLNRLATYQCGLLMLSLSITLCPISTTYTGLVAFSVVFGFFEGCFSSYIIIITSDCVKRHQTNAAFGMAYSASSFFSLVGPPFAGFVYTSSGSYLVAFVICGANITLSILLMFLIPWFIPDDVYQEKFLEKQLLCKSITENVFYEKPEDRSYQVNKKFFGLTSRNKLKSAKERGLMRSIHDMMKCYQVYTETQRGADDIRRTLLGAQSDLVVVDKVSCV